MIAIRLARFGHKNAPFYRVVAVNSRQKQGGTVLEYLGTWNPKQKELKVKSEKLKEWVAKGAQVSLTVKKLIKQAK